MSEYMSEYIEQAEKFLADNDATVKIEFSWYGPYWGANRNTYEVTIERHGRTYKCEFHDSVHNTQQGNEPSVYDVLACLQKYPVGEYWEFCSEFGLDNSKESWDTYEAVKAEYEGVSYVFEGCMEEFEEII